MTDSSVAHRLFVPSLTVSRIYMFAHRWSNPDMAKNSKLSDFTATVC